MLDEKLFWGNDTTPLKLEELKISNKKALYDYLHNDFAILFFTEGRFV